MIDSLPHSTEHPKRRRWTLWHVLWIGAGLSAVLLVGTAVYLFIDEVPPDDSDFRFTRKIVSDEENGFVVATEDVEIEIVPADFEGKDGQKCGGDGEDDDTRPISLTAMLDMMALPFQSGWKIEKSRRVVALCPRLLSNFEESLRRPKFVVPELSFTEIDSVLDNIRDMATLAVLRAGVLFEEGSERAALDEALKVVRLGHRLECAEGGLGVLLRGMSIKTIGGDLFKSLIQHATLQDREIEETLREFERCVVPDEAWTTAMRNEYAEAGRKIDNLAEGGVSGSQATKFVMRFALNPNQTRRLLLERVRPALRFRAPWNGSGRILEPEAEQRDSSFSLWPPKNLAGKGLVSVAFSFGRGPLESMGWEHILLQTPRLLFTLRKFTRARGALPDRLEELVPEFIEKLPVDPFSGGTFQYSKEKKELRAGGSWEPVAMIEFADKR